MRNIPIGKTALVYALAAGLAGGAFAETLDFESPAYTTEKSVVGSDGWLLASDAAASAQDNFKIQAGAAGEGRWVHARVSGLSAAYRPIAAPLGSAQFIDLRWRWRALSDSTRFCVGLAGGAGNARQANRALACLEPGGGVSAQGAAAIIAPALATWRKGAWLYMRMALDNGSGTAGRFTLYVSDDSLRAIERIAVAAGPMGGSGALARVVLRTEEGSGSADVDDISWDAVAQWQPSADGDLAWSNGKNWSTGSAPDSNTRVLFPDGGLRGCLLDQDATVQSVTLATGFQGTLDFGNRTLNVLGNADFTGGATAAAAGQIRFPSGRGSSLIGSQSSKALPLVRHDGKGLLRLDGRALLAGGLIQAGGVFAFNGVDLMLTGDWVVQGGGPGTLRNLDGRAIVVVHTVRLEGKSPDSLLGLATAPKGWVLNQAGADSLTARFARLGNARATGNPGIAYRSVDAGGNADWSFFAGPEAPLVTPKGRTFPDTLRIRASGDSGATVRYTLDGSAPGPGSPLFPAQGILLDSSADLKAIQVKNGAAGPIARETYSLVPEAPFVSPQGGDYSSPIRVELASSAPRAVVYYTLDGSMPGPERGLAPYSGPIEIAGNATLKAVAVAGTGAKLARGPIRVENYAFIATGKRTLAGGQRLQISGNYSLTSKYAGASPVDVEILAADSLAAGLEGFRDVLFGIRLSMPDGAGGFPKVSLNCPAGEPRALFQAAGAEAVRWVSAADTSSIDAPGAYFLAVDTAAPVLRFAGETFTGEDSTRLVVTIEDNVQNLALDLDRSDDPSAGFTNREVSPNLVMAVNAKNPKGDPKPLTLKLRVHDHTRSAAFPPDGSAYQLAQKFAEGTRSPAAFRIGADAQAPWDMISVPLPTEKPITMSQLRKNNDRSSLQGFALDSSTGKYRLLASEEPIPPGRSVWLAAPASLTSLAFPALQTASLRGKASARLTLHPGWNQVANPGLAPLWWPVSRSMGESYRYSLLKGLRFWDAVAGEYGHAESLEPWRGYLAYYYGGRDTVVTLLEEPPVVLPKRAAAGMKAAAAGNGEGALGIAVRFSWSDGSELTLGAAAGAGDGFGIEDEARPPSPGTGGTRLFSDRAGARLETDIVGWRPGAICAWKVVAGLDPSAGDALTALSESLPPGYSAWAVSRSRDMRFPLSAAATETALPWHPGYTDTLEVLAGPAAELESRLGRIPLRPGPFFARTLPRPGGYSLSLNLPSAGRLRLTLFSLDGRSVEDRILELPAGRYRLEGAGHRAPGLYALRILAFVAGAGTGEGGGIPSKTSLKLAIP